MWIGVVYVLTICTIEGCSSLQVRKRKRVVREATMAGALKWHRIPSPYVFPLEVKTVIYDIVLIMVRSGEIDAE